MYDIINQEKVPHIREAHLDDKYCSLVFLTKHGDSTMVAGNDPVYTVSCIRGGIGRYWGCNTIFTISIWKNQYNV